jgi:hypothetical protein
MSCKGGSPSRLSINAASTDRLGARDEISAPLSDEPWNSPSEDPDLLPPQFY